MICQHEAISNLNHDDVLGRDIISERKDGQAVNPFQKTDQTNKKIPRHIAVIMDGNGRWAKARMRPRVWGHQQGVDSVREIVTSCGELGVEYLTLYAFSDENWARPKPEVSALLRLLDKFVEKEAKSLDSKGVCLRVIGDLARLPADSVSRLNRLCDKLAHNSRLNLTLAISYGARHELARACSKIATECIEKKLDIDSINPELMEQYLDTSGLPNPDLLIRTSGEQRVSNFLLWQIAYAELWFTDVHWPDFRKQHLIAAIEDYSQRVRRFGLTDEQVQS